MDCSFVEGIVIFAPFGLIVGFGSGVGFISIKFRHF